ncbi:MAG: carbohydrate binding family 9 domain-containing protein [Candidatus Latescibacterota bacterium]
MKRYSVALHILEVMLMFCVVPRTAPVSAVPVRPMFEPVKITTTPVIDGIFTDASWKCAPTLSTDFISYNPLKGQTLPMKTEVWAAYDSRNLYFAFRCQDPEPGKIKTSVTQRDNIFSDDWVGISLDALGSRQSSYDLFVNPHGMQADILTSISNGEDVAPDWVWQSAGRITPEGYQVEMCIPLRNIRYQSGDTVAMGIIFWRKISRLGLSGSWPAMPDGGSFFSVHADMPLHGIATGRNITVLPSVTFSSNREREHPGIWNTADRAGNLGFGLTYGITSTLTAEATVNPDFSQVESDAFQVTVNRRYPVFYSEKRPYFMETRGFFNIAGAGDNSFFRTAVHTRKIADPFWSAKLNGVAGNTAYGVLLAEDAWKGGETGSRKAEHNPRFAIARGKYTIKGNSYIGGIYTGHMAGNEFNHVAGVDGVIIPRRSHTIAFSLLEGVSKPGLSSRERNGSLASINHKYLTRSFMTMSYFERCARDFSMDTAFYDRTGFTRVQNATGLKYYPSGKYSWIRQVLSFGYVSAMKDAVSGKQDYEANITLQADFTRQGFALVRHSIGRESWTGKYFHPESTEFSGSIQALNQVFLHSYFNTGRWIYYDSTLPFLGDGTSYGGGLTLQPNDKFRQSVDYNYSALRNPADGVRTYAVHVVNTRSTYQFNRYFFLRASLQYDSWKDTLLQDYLASFTLIPGTVIHLGYGSLSERQELREGQWKRGYGNLHPVRESLFFKTSYLHRF